LFFLNKLLLFSQRCITCVKKWQ